MNKFQKMTLALPAFGSLAAFAADPVSLPETGVDVGGYITTAITGLGAIVAVAVGGYFAFLLIRKGLQWARKMA